MNHDIIHMISGPRNLSTAIMYSFANRVDTKVIDEPLYAAYLTQHPEIDHPGKEETLASQLHDVKEVIDQQFKSPPDASFLFIKNMAHHLEGLDWAFLTRYKTILLIRHPRDIIASFARVITHPTMLDIGIELEAEILQYLRERGQVPIVLHSDLLKAHPRKCLEALCEKLNIPFSDRMLRWEAGPRAEDGVWAKYWYHNVHRSTGFSKKALSQHPFPDHLEPLLMEALPYYKQLETHALQL